jgi:hypothetical protein
MDRHLRGSTKYDSQTSCKSSISYFKTIQRNRHWRRWRRWWCWWSWWSRRCWRRWWWHRLRWTVCITIAGFGPVSCAKPTTTTTWIASTGRGITPCTPATFRIRWAWCRRRRGHWCRNWCRCWHRPRTWNWCRNWCRHRTWNWHCGALGIR